MGNYHIAITSLGYYAHLHFICRRKPVFHEGVQYDLSLLITNDITETMTKAKLIEWVIAFMQDISKELYDIKMGVCGLLFTHFTTPRPLS